MNTKRKSEFDKIVTIILALIGLWTIMSSIWSEFVESKKGEHQWYSPAMTFGGNDVTINAPAVVARKIDVNGSTEWVIAAYVDKEHFFMEVYTHNGIQHGIVLKVGESKDFDNEDGTGIRLTVKKIDPEHDSAVCDLVIRKKTDKAKA